MIDDFYWNTKAFTDGKDIEIRDFLIGALITYLKPEQITQAIETAFECKELLEKTRKSA